MSQRVSQRVSASKRPAPGPRLLDPAWVAARLARLRPELLRAAGLARAADPSRYVVRLTELHGRVYIQPDGISGAFVPEWGECALVDTQTMEHLAHGSLSEHEGDTEDHAEEDRDT